jgi:excisionase family DNA binding protein
MSSLPAEDENEVLTAEEVAKMLNIPKSRVYQAARDKEIPSTPSLGRYVRFRRADVEAFIRGERSFLTSRHL